VRYGRAAPDTDYSLHSEFQLRLKMAYTLPSEDFMFPHMVAAKHSHGNAQVYDRVTGARAPGIIVAMSEGKWVVELNEGKYILHEGNWAFAHGVGHQRL
jgi:hypothetical protein